MRTKRTQHHRKKGLLLSLFLLLLLVFGLQVSAAPEMSESAQKKVYLTAATSNGTIIEPEAVPYTEGQTVKQILLSSGHVFAGLEEKGYIDSIDGISGNFMYFYDGNKYALDEVPEKLTVICFTEVENAWSSEMEDLIRYVGAYREREDFSRIQKYEPAKEAYDAALKGIRTGKNAAELQESLEKAVADYEAILNGTKYSVNFSATQGSKTVTALSITMTDQYGNVSTAKGTQIQVVAGTYQFSVSDGGYNRVDGEVVVKGQQSVTVTLPDGEWFGEINLLDDDRAKKSFAKEQDTNAHRAVYQIPDVTGTTAIILNAAYGKGIPDSKTTLLRTIYVGVNGTDASDISRSWNSTATKLSQCVKNGLEGRTFLLEAQYPVKDKSRADYGYTMIQSYKMVLERYPTLRALSVKDGDTELLTGFDGMQTEYSLTTVGDSLTIAGTPFEEEGCSVLVNGRNTNTVSVNQGQTDVQVQVVCDTTGKKSEYTLHITKKASVSVTLDTPADTSVAVMNAAGSEIRPGTNGTYALIPGAEYTYVATLDTWYHTTASFTAEEGLTVKVEKPVKEDAMTAFALYSRSGIYAPYELENAFSADTHEVSCIIPDANNMAYVSAAGLDGYSIKALYTVQHNMLDTKVEKSVGSDAGKSTSLGGQFLLVSGYGQKLVMRLTKTDSAKTATWYQDYEVTIRRSAHLNDGRGVAPSLADDSGKLSLMDKEGKVVSFDRDTTEYWVMIERGAQNLTLNAKFYNEDKDTRWGGGFYAVIDGKHYDSLTDVALDLGDNPDSWNSKDITIQVCHEDKNSISTSYVLHITQIDPVKITFKTTPENARTFVVNSNNGRSVKASADGTYGLIPGQTYEYHVTCKGYVGKKETYKTPDQAATVTVALDKAADNTSLKNFDAEWPSFRCDANNNGVINSPVPKTAEEAVLNWSVKLGDGYGSNATGCPIIVDDSIYVYGDTSIYKIDKISGEIKAQGSMAHSSSFGINPPTYADGMIFVGLSGGDIQAFNADTLKPLWIYHDALGGQPNCPIIYHDGYLYTGFWNGEKLDGNFACISVTDEDPSREDEEKLASWTYTQKGGFYWAGAYACDQFILVGTDDGEDGYDKGYSNVLSLDPKTGRVIDQVQLKEVGDLRSTITREEGTNNYYFTTKGGYFYRLQVNEDGTMVQNSLTALLLDNGSGSNRTPAMSTSTPTIYNGRAYIGVSGVSQFGAYSGHNITVIDLDSFSIAYKVITQGYPQTSGVLTTAYEEKEGKAYIYFFDNYTPGKLRVITDQKGQTAPEQTITEIYNDKGSEKTYQTAPVLFTPVGEDAQYALCTPIIDTDGTIYFKNDSARLMSLSSTIENLTIDQEPTKMKYAVGDTFNPAGMKVTAHYTNGTTRDVTDYVTYSKDPLSATDVNFTIRFKYVKYQNKDGNAGVPYDEPYVVLKLQVGDRTTVLGDVNEDGVVNDEDAELVYKFATGREDATEEQKVLADVNGDGMIDSMDASWIYAYSKGKITQFPGQQETEEQTKEE